MTTKHNCGLPVESPFLFLIKYILLSFHALLVCVQVPLVLEITALKLNVCLVFSGRTSGLLESPRLVSGNLLVIKIFICNDLCISND